MPGGGGGGRGAASNPNALQSFFELNNAFNTMVSMMQVGLDMAPTPALAERLHRPEPYHDCVGGCSETGHRLQRDAGQKQLAGDEGCPHQAHRFDLQLYARTSQEGKEVTFLGSRLVKPNALVAEVPGSESGRMVGHLGECCARNCIRKRSLPPFRAVSTDPASPDFDQRVTCFVLNPFRQTDVS